MYTPIKKTFTKKLTILFKKWFNITKNSKCRKKILNYISRVVGNGTYVSYV